jgi:hypothetical protein
MLIEFGRSGKLRFPPETLRVIDLEAVQVNAALDGLQDSIDHVRAATRVAGDECPVTCDKLNGFAERYANAVVQP